MGRYTRTNIGGVIIPIHTLTREQLTLLLAKVEYPRYDSGDGIQLVQCNDDYYVWVSGDGEGFRVSLNWKTCGPIWEREADKYVRFLGLREVDASYFNIHFKARAFEASKSPESIARARLSMKFPNGIPDWMMEGV